MSKPTPLSPKEDSLVHSLAVHFSWLPDDRAYKYLVQFSRDPNFSEFYSKRIPASPKSDKYACLPDKVLECGKWYWRVFSMDSEGKPLGVSETKSFTVYSRAETKKRELVISREHPLIILFSHSTPEHIVLNWESLPEDIKPYIVFRVEKNPIEDLLAVCDKAEDKEIPILVQVAGPHDVIGGIYRRITLTEVEEIFEKYSCVKGVQIVEQACQGGLREEKVRSYLLRLIKLAGLYGKTVVWADGHWYENRL